MNGYRAPEVWWVCDACGLPLAAGAYCEDCGSAGAPLTGESEIIRRHDA